MENGKGIKVYRFTRGEKYSCDVIIDKDEHVVYSNIIFPANTVPEVVNKLCSDAEREALRLFRAEQDKRHG